MLSQRLTKLFSLLQCSNTEIARYVGCSPSNVSRLKSGGREPKASSRTVARLAGGIYRYADYENMLPVLCELCDMEDSSPERLVPAVISWLYETADFTAPRALTPRTKRTQALMRQSFGKRLERAMTLLELSNAQLAVQMNVDVSLISRYRSGIYSPHGNERMTEKLSDVLFSHAQRIERLEALAELCSLPREALDPETLADWLCAPVEEEPSALARALLRSLDTLSPAPAAPDMSALYPAARAKPCYWGADGLREAVIRLLRDAARAGGELLLYSDEPMDRVTGDRAYFEQWRALLAQCVQNGVKITLIHIVDRDAHEIADAIADWFPLYLSGTVRSYVLRRARNAHFRHTILLRPGGACIHGFFPIGAGEERWYDYITDRAKLNVLKAEFEAMLSLASPFLRAYPLSCGADFHAYCDTRTAARDYLLSGLPVFTMPEELLRRVLERAPLSAAKRREVLSLYHARRTQFRETLSREPTNLLFCLPTPERVRAGVGVNFAADLIDLRLDYTSTEYAEHLRALAALAAQEKNFHLTLLPSTPFWNIRIVSFRDAAAVLRCEAPYAAFVFTDPAFAQSVSDYVGALTDLYAADRRTTVRALDALADSLC